MPNFLDFLTYFQIESQFSAQNQSRNEIFLTYMSDVLSYVRKLQVQNGLYFMWKSLLSFSDTCTVLLMIVGVQADFGKVNFI